MAKIKIDLDNFDNLWTGTTAHELVNALGGNDTLEGGAGNDTLYGGKGDNSLSGGTGDDQVYGGPGIDTLYGGDGNDIVVGNGGHDQLFGGIGNDTLSVASLVGAFGYVTLDGGLGDDYFNLAGLVGGSVQVDAGDGNDAVSFARAGQYTAALDVGAGVDRLSLSASAAAHIDAGGISTVFSPFSGQTPSTFQRFEVFDLILSAADDWIKLGAGDDRVYGNGGADRIRVGAGNDAVTVTVDQAIVADGGQGTDTLHVAIGTAAYVLTVDRATGTVTDNLGSVMTGFESLYVSTGVSQAKINFGQGDDVYRGFLGHDSVFGYGGNDPIEGAAWANGGGGNDVLTAGAAGAVLNGGSGNDVLTVVFALTGSATLNGNDGQDVIEMDWATVLATGGADADTFVIGPSSGLGHHITDFTPGTDVLQVADAGVSTLTALTADAFAYGTATAATAQYILRQDAVANLTALFYDADGTGAGTEVLVVNLDGLVGAQSSDIWIF